MRNILIEDKDKIEICEYEMMYNLELGFPLLKQADGFNEKIHYSKNSNIWFVRDKNVNTVHYSFGYFEENAVFDNLAPIFVIKLNSNYPLMSSLNAYFIINERTGRRSLTLNSKIYDDLGIDFTTMDVFNFREGLVELGSVDDANEIIKNLDVLMLRLKSQYEGDDVYTDDNSTSEVNDSQHLSNKDYSDFNQVLSYFKNEKYGECIALLDSISEDEFKYFNGYGIKGACLYFLDRYDKAIECFDKIIDEKQNSFDLNFKGFSLMGLNRYGEALKCFYKSLELDSENKTTLEMIKFLEEELGVTTENPEFSKADSKSRIKSESQFKTKDTLQLSKKSKIKSESQLKTKNLLETKDQLKTKDITQSPKKGNKKLEKSIKKTNKGYSLLGKGRFSLALNEFERAIKSDKSNADAWLGKGQSEACLNKHKDAINSYKKALELHNDNYDAMSGIGWCYLALNNQEEAIVWFDKAIAINENNAGVWVGKGVAYNNMDDFDNALENIEKGLAIDGKYVPGLFFKALILKHMEKYTEALECCDNALDLIPDQKSIIELKEELEFIIELLDEENESLNGDLEYLGELTRDLEELDELLGDLLDLEE